MALPGVISGAVVTGDLGAGVDVVDAWIGLVDGRQPVGLLCSPRVVAPREGVFGDGLEVPGGDQIVERLWRLLLVDSVGADRSAHDLEVLAKHVFLGGHNIAGIHQIGYPAVTRSSSACGAFCLSTV